MTQHCTQANPDPPTNNYFNHNLNFDQNSDQNLYQNFFDHHDSNHHHIHVRADPRITAEFLALHCLTDSGALGCKLDQRKNIVLKRVKK